jgi:formamidopyrimidine-DNA glycosylase
VPELPEVEALAQFVAGQAGGQEVTRAEPASLSAIKTFRPPIEDLVGRTVVGAGRRGKHLLVETAANVPAPGGEPPSGGSDRLWLVVHLSLGGWLQWRDPAPAARARPGKGPLALRVALASGAGFDLTEQGTEKRLAIWLVADPDEVEGVARLGPDPLDPGFDPTALGAVLASRPGNLKTVLVDQCALAGVGNAYSDEALHQARLSPFKPAGKLTAEELARLHAALVGVLGDAVERSRGLPAKGLKGEKRSGMAVHGRTGEPCPVCGDTIRQVAFASRSLQYCPTCQTSGKVLADRRLSRLLK